MRAEIFFFFCDGTNQDRAAWISFVIHIGDSLEERLDVSRVASRSRPRLIIAAGRELGT